MLPPDGRPAGWDLVFVEGVVGGAVGAELLLQLTTENQTIRLGIANENEALFFRENLRMLAHAPGLNLQLIARIDPDEPRIAYPLAAAPVVRNVQKDAQPKLELPEPMHERICLGFDEMQRKYLLNAESAPVVIGEKIAESDHDDPLATLRRRWIAMILAGSAFHVQTKTNTLAQEIATLHRIGFKTGAALLNSVSRCHGSEKPNDVDVFLAIALYLRSSYIEMATSTAMFGTRN